MRRLKPQLLRGGIPLVEETMTKIRILGLLSAGLVLMLAGCGLSGEPEIDHEIALPTAAPSLEAVVDVPDLGQGAVFYVDHCAMCHGDNGLGDGEMVQDGRLQTAPPLLTNLSEQGTTPLEYWQIITDGNMMAGMPPFSGYSAAERWDVTAYVYTGGLTADQLATGAEVFSMACAGCHGAGGQGDGSQASGIMPDFTELTFWTEQDGAGLRRVVSEGYGGEMPGFADQLSAEAIDAVVGHVQTLALQGVAGFPTGDAPEMAAAETPSLDDAAGFTCANRDSG